MSGISLEVEGAFLDWNNDIWADMSPTSVYKPYGAEARRECDMSKYIVLEDENGNRLMYNPDCSDI